MSGGWSPLYAGMFEGSLRGKTAQLLVWTWILAFKDRDGVIDQHPRCCADATGLAVDVVVSVLAEFCEPDPESRSQVEQGRRLIPLAGSGFGWQCVNHVVYREKARKREYDQLRTETGADRSRKRDQRAGFPVKHELSQRDGGRCGVCVQPVAIADAYVDHIRPLILGGTDDTWNKQLVHRGCNAAKATGNSRGVPARHPDMPKVECPTAVPTCPTESHRFPLSYADADADADTDTDSETESEGDARGNKRAVARRAVRRMPVEYQPSEILRCWAAEKCPLVNLEATLETIRDHEFKVARSDWDAVIRNWMRKEQRDEEHRQRNRPGTRETAHQRLKRTLRDAGK
jgi:5-methylcytosine-specific restriction endonuclease McrA